MDTLLQDIRFGIRVLIKRPGFASLAVIALALGVGANTAIFSAVEAILLRPLPYEKPEELVSLWETDVDTGGQQSFSAANFVDWQEQCRSCSHMSMFDLLSMNLTGGQDPERVPVAAVSANLFDTLAARPEFGRSFLPDEEKPGANRVVILSHGIWQRRFGADSAIVGQTLNLNGVVREVIGVMPAGFQFPLPNMARNLGEFTGSADIWVPLPLARNQLSRTNHNRAGLARLNPGVTVAQAQAEMDAISRGLGERYPDSNSKVGVKLVALHKQVVGDVRLSLLVLFASVGFVLLIACVNVANLLLARAAGRRREVAVRLALGAGRSRIVRQLMTESLMLALCGGAAGFLLALWGMDLLIGQIPSGVYGVGTIGVDPLVFLFTLATTLATGLLFGLAPALHGSKPDLNESLKEGSGAVVPGSRRQGLRSLLIVSEVALSLVLLIGAGLTIRSFARLRSVDTGFARENVITAQFSLPGSKYQNQQKWADFYKRSLERLEGIPGVQAVGMVSHLPLSGSDAAFSFEIEKHPTGPDGRSPWARIRAATPDYFKAMGIPLIGGREFDDRDAQGKPAVLIISEQMAERYWPGEDPLGKRISFDFDRKQSGKANWIDVVGVVKGVRHSNVKTEPEPQMYVPYEQLCTSSMSVVVRSAADQEAMIGAIRDAIHQIDGDQPIYNVRATSELVSESAAGSRFTTLALTVFAGVALLLAIVGIYGVMSYLVAQRIREIGIRMALGAQRRSVMRLVVGHGMKLALAGVAIGLVGAFGLTRLMSSLLFEMSPTDPLTFAAVSLILAAVSLVATYVPARRASRVDPMLALRHE
jgi:putative ABC transport system permease protein